MKVNLERLAEMIFCLTLKFGRDHKDSFTPEEAMFDEDGIIYNCSFGKFVCDLGEVVTGVGDVRISTTLTMTESWIRAYQGRVWARPDKLVFEYVSGDERVSEWAYHEGNWEQVIIDEFKRKRS